MGQLTQKWDKIREVIYEHPDKRMTVREIAKKAGVPKSTVQKHLKIICREKEANPELFRIKKINHYVEKLFSVRLIRKIEEELHPSCIILFGSFSKGDYSRESDIDLFIETTSSKTAEISDYERQLRHSVHVIQEADIKNVPALLRNNIINGIKLSGFFRI